MNQGPLKALRFLTHRQLISLDLTGNDQWKKRQHEVIMKFESTSDDGEALVIGQGFLIEARKNGLP
jgi:hypothetical protein